MQTSTFPSPVGEIRMLADQTGLAAVYFPEQAADIEPRLAPFGKRRGHGNLFLLNAEAFLACYFAGDLAYSPEVPLVLKGTSFQLEVWQALRTIPPGSRISYAGLAAQMGRPASVRAVAGAVARNPVSILVPCHRVIGSDGRLRGYAGGLERKRALLAHERRCSAGGPDEPAEGDPLRARGQ